MNESVMWFAKVLATALEHVLAFGILLGVIAFAVGSVSALIGLDWHSTETFYELIYRTLLLVIGVELIRTLLTPIFFAILELLAFVVARKMLKPELPPLTFCWASRPLWSSWLHVDFFFLRARVRRRPENE
jgi:hypothetical protein